MTRAADFWAEHGPDIVSYDPCTGTFTYVNVAPAHLFANSRSPKTWQTKCAGKPARKSLTGGGYVWLGFVSHRVAAHRYAWFVCNGRWPEVVDHINGDKADNRIANLRECTQAQNTANRSKQASASRFKGLTPWNGKWFAQISSQGRKHYLGLFENEIEGARAYDRAARTLHGAFAKLNFPNDNPMFGGRTA